MTTTLIPEIGLQRSPAADEGAAPTIRCTLGEAERGRRAETLRHGLLGHITDVQPLCNPETGREGARLCFDGAGDALAGEIDEFVAFEQGCCGFADFQTGVEAGGAEQAGREGDALWLDITGPPGTQAFLARWVPGASAAFEATKGSARGVAVSTPKILGLAGLGLLMCCIAPILGAFGFAALATSAGVWLEAASVVLLGAAAYTWWRGRRAAQPSPGAPDGDGCGC